MLCDQYAHAREGRSAHLKKASTLKKRQPAGGSLTLTGVHLGVHQKIENLKAALAVAFRKQFCSPRHQNRVRSNPEKAGNPSKIRVSGLFYVQSGPKGLLNAANL